MKRGNPGNGVTAIPRKRAARKTRRNPPLLVFGNPQEVLSRDAVEVKYKHAKDGKYYSHHFKKGQCHIVTSDGGKTATFVRTDGKPVLREF